MSGTTLGNITVRMLLASFALSLLSCGYGTSNACSISTNISPTTAMADHSAAPPGNQVQFMAAGSTSGNMCPMTPDFMGTWSTSDPADTTINTSMAQPQNVALVTCVNATSTPVTISNSSTVRGKSFPAAKLTCN